MNLKHLSDQTLLQETKCLVRQEREILATLLHHLREVEKRRLFSNSLFDYVQNELGYPRDQAGRRISAMRLLAQLPEIEGAVEAGELNVTTLTMARTAFNTKECTKEEKLEILESIKNKTTREAEMILIAFAPETPKPDKVRALSEEEIELRFTADKEVLEKVEALKGLLAHKHPGLSMGDLLKMLCDLGLKTWSKEEKSVAAPQAAPSQAAVRRQVWSKAKSQCEKCGSRYALQIDHIKPKALGGPDTRENLRLLCRACNQRAAIEAFGIKKMDEYLNRVNTG